MTSCFTQGEKWLANLWVWNGPRHEFWEDEEGVVGGDVGVLRPRGKDVLPQVVTARANVPILVTFKSIDAEGVYLFWNDVVSALAVLNIHVLII